MKSFNQQILIGTLLGITLGFVINYLGVDHAFSVPTLYVCGIIASIFIKLLKMILIPLVFTSITVGIANLRAHAQMDRVWKTAIIYYLSTTALAVIIGLLSVNVFKPGVGLEVSMFQESMSKFSAESVTVGQFIQMFIANLFMNPIAAMAQGQVLPTIIFALFFGIALVVTGEKSKVVLDFFNQLFNLIMMMVNWVMKILPLGLMALLTKLVSSQDAGMFVILGKFMLVVIGTTLFHGFVSLPLVLKFFAKKDPKVFFAGVKDALVTAFSTSSSSATLPITMKCVEDELKVDKDVSGFVLPLGATVNMDGTAMYEAIACIFVANLTGIELNLLQQIIVFFTAIIAAIGAPGIPSAGMVTMIMVLQSVGLPIEAISILIPIDRLLDAIRTTVNVEGDAIGSCVVDRITSQK